MKKKIKTSKNVKPKTIKYENEDTNQFRKFIIILICVAIVSGLLYFLTAKYLVKDKFQESESTSTETTISYTSVKAGNVFNRPYDEYYVFAYDSSASRAVYYASLISNYSGDAKVYFLDLGIEVNKKYVSETGNSKATTPSELSLKIPTLMQIKNGKITAYYETEEEIENILK